MPIASPVTNTSISLRWNWNLSVLHLLHQHNSTVSLQWRVARPEMGGTWETVPSSSEISQSHAVVNELQPFSSYRVSSLVIKNCFYQSFLVSNSSKTISYLLNALLLPYYMASFWLSNESFINMFNMKFNCSHYHFTVSINGGNSSWSWALVFKRNCHYHNSSVWFAKVCASES